MHRANTNEDVPSGWNVLVFCCYAYKKGLADQVELPGIQKGWYL